MNFIPQNQEAKKVPYFEDVAGKSSEGWEGHESEKSIDRLKNEVAEAIGRLGGFVSHYQSGDFEIGDMRRSGLRLFYSLGGVPARIDIAALPVRRPSNRERSLKMALYMLRDGLRGLWFFQQLSPGYAPLMPFMIADNEGHTVSQLWAGREIGKLLPPSASEFIEGEEV